jgi:hypothetical protein
MRLVYSMYIPNFICAQLNNIIPRFIQLNRARRFALLEGTTTLIYLT